MPLYEFRCHWCGHTFERFRPLAACRDATPCPACARPAPRVFSAPIVDNYTVGRDVGSVTGGFGDSAGKSRRNPQVNVERQQRLEHAWREQDQARAAFAREQREGD